VPLDLHFWEDFRDSALLVDNDGCALYSHICDPVELLLLPDAIRLGQLVAFVDKQVVRQRVFLTELLVRFCAVRAYAKNDCIELPEPGKGVAKVARLTRSARGVVFGIEKEDDLPAAERRERNSRAFVCLEVELGCRLANFNH
jgi:hypothetical protein